MRSKQVAQTTEQKIKVLERSIKKFGDPKNSQGKHPKAEAIAKLKSEIKS